MLDFMWTFCEAISFDQRLIPGSGMEPKSILAVSFFPERVRA
jgi:hypothetical protein